MDYSRIDYASVSDEDLVNAISDSLAVEFDPSIVITIIGIVIDLLKNCKGPVKDMVGPTKGLYRKTLVQLAVARRLREQFGVGAYFAKGGSDITRRILEEAVKAPPEMASRLRSIDLAESA